MATIDGREGDPTFRGEIYLKIWHWKAGTWILNTRIDRPHGLKKITALAFSPATRNDSLYLVTTGQDGNVKTWRLRSLRGKEGVSEGWYHLASRGICTYY
jgi:NET1-associated nuclear protein 1 (U3 small nucleolar RNA-associated protein 17)